MYLKIVKARINKALYVCFLRYYYTWNISEWNIITGHFDAQFSIINKTVDKDLN